MTVAVSTFYKYVRISDCEAMRIALLQLCLVHGIKGTILIATEGVNATVSGRPAALEALHSVLGSMIGGQCLTNKLSAAPEHPFARMKIKIKPEIVTFGAERANPSQGVGRHVAAEDWNALVIDPNVVLVDVRNDYEVALGSFPGAINPGTRSFREFPAFVDRELANAREKSIAMFCTGGIRCEKASSYLLSQGFRDVRQLAGGILKYLEAAPPNESLWLGECFVFDTRVSVGHGEVPGSHALCQRCGRPMAKAEDELALCSKCADAQSSATWPVH
ncbi:MAG: rhodanese-related sulfurtransferase [Hyphomicrobium sp.]